MPMVANSRMCAILHLSICLPMRWLAGNCHRLHKDDPSWGVFSMGEVDDALHSAMMIIKNNPSKFLSEDFIMTIFSTFRKQLKSFDDYITYFMEHKTSHTVNNIEMFLPFDELNTELFYPQDESN